MRTILYHLAAPLLAAALSMAATSAAAQNFQRQFGTAFDNAFVKVVRHGTNYYVLGRDQAAAGALNRATVTRLNNLGVIQWVRRLDIASQWNDAVLTSNGNLLLVGQTLPADASSRSLMGLLTAAGTFSYVNTYETFGRESLHRIVRNPAPQSASFPYYVLGTQIQSGSTTVDDVILWNVSESGNFNWKKLYASQANDLFNRDFEALSNGDMLISGNHGNSVIFRVNNTGNIIGGATTSAMSAIVDVHPRTGGGFYAVGFGGAAPNIQVYLVKFDNDLLNLWETRITGLTAVSQVWEDTPNGWIYVVGTGIFNGKSRAVVIRLIETGDEATQEWVKFLDNGETSYTGGSLWRLSSTQMAFVDGRIPLSGGFGQVCAFMSVSDLDMATCITVEGTVSTDKVPLIFDGPVGPEVQFFDTPPPATVANSTPTWQQAEVCNNAPCVAAFTSAPIAGCRNFQFTNQSSGPTPPPLTYLWNFGDPMSGANNTSTATNPTHQFTKCGTYTVCLTVTGAGCTASVCHQVVATDNVPPMVVCPPNITIKCNQQLSPFFTGTATVTDNCTPNMVAAYTDAVSGNMPCDATVLRTWTATDSCGNKSNCTQVITVRDDIPPTISCPQNVSVNTLPGLCYYTFVHLQQMGVTATDNCDVPAIICTWEDPNGTILPYTLQTQLPKGVLKFRCFSRDQCGNVSPTCTFTVTVTDNEPPMITCPQNLSVTGTINPQGLCKATVNGIAATATDNCPMLSVSYTTVPPANGGGSSDASGAMFMQGVTTVTYTATDMAGSKTTCSFTVTVECPQGDFPGFQCGQAVMTCFSGFVPSTATADPNGPVLALVDLRQHALAPLGMNWWNSPPNIYHKSTWTAANMGQVFGVTIDGNYNVYASATTMYGRYSPRPAADYGNVYKIDATTGNVSVFATLPQNLSSPAGLGDVWWDAGSNQIFVSNFTDGRIYYYNMSGALLGVYDFPSTAIGTPSAGFVARGERVWAVATYNNRLYFSVWNEDRVNQNPGGFNEIRSVGLSGGVPTGPALLVHQMSSLTTASLLNYSSPVSDIHFSKTGNMLVAERSMYGDVGNSFTAWSNNSHQGRIIELSPTGTWATERILHVGNAYNTGSTVSYHANSAGGTDYGYESFNPAAMPKPTQCDSIVWGTGDALRFPGYNSALNDASSLPCSGGVSDRVYGLAGVRWTGNSNQPSATNFVKNSSIYIDIDNNLCTSDKTQLGDVDVFDCGCPGGGPSVCDSISVTSMPFNGPQDTCCFKLTLKNDKPNYFTTIQICAQNGVSISTVSVLNGCVLQGANASMVTIAPQGGIGSYFPVVSAKDFVKFCLSNYQITSPQKIIIKYFGPNFTEVCRDTLIYNCTQKPKCLKITPTVLCGPPGSGTYTMNFCIMSDPLIAFNVNSIVLNAPPGYTFTPNTFPVIPPLTPGSMRCGFTTTISGPNAVDGATFCFTLTGKSGPLGTSDLYCCTDTVMKACVTLPECVCSKVSVSAAPVTVPGKKCCWELTLTNNYSNTFFSGVQLCSLTPGVVFGCINNNGLPPAWILNSGSTMATLTKFPPGACLGQTEVLPAFCLSGLTSSTQLVEVKWLDKNGKVVCRDTLTFHCEPPEETDCAVIVNPLVVCDLNTPGGYTFSFQVYNNTGANGGTAFNINQVQLTNITGGTMSPTVFPISPAISYTQTSGVLTTSINGPLPGQQICFTLTVHEIGPNGNELNCCTHSQTYCFTMPDWPVDCDCGPDPFTLLYGVGHGPILPKHCGDTLFVPDIPNLPIQFYPSFQCIGLNCPPATVTYMLTGPPGFTPIGPITVAATPGFSTGITNATFTLPGTYMLNMIGHCGQKECPCKLTFIVPKKDSCCVNYDQFCQNVMNATSVTVDNNLCKATLNTSNLPACDQIAWVNWGQGPVQFGPFVSGAMPMHTYTGSGTYIISYLAEEYDLSVTPPKLCFEKLLRDTIVLDCPCDNTLPTIGLTGYFPFAGNAVDLSSIGVNGTVNGATLTTGHDNVSGSAYLFGGSSNWIDCGINNRGVTNAVSVCAWVRTGETVNGQWVAGKYGGLTGLTDHGYILAIGNLAGGNIGQATFDGRDGTGIYHTSGFSAKKINDDKWHCLVGTAGGNQWAVYVDGSNPVDGNAMPGSSTNLVTSNPFTIGRNSDPGLPPLWMNGSIDNVLVYNRVLTPQEIECFCKGTLPPPPCECGKFTDLFWRPAQGAPTLPVMCGDVLNVGCNPNFNPILSGNFMCMGNCPPPAFPIQWELRQLPNGPVVASGNLSGPAFSLALLASYFNTAGMYELTLTSQCGSQVCPPCKFKINATGCPCECGTFKDLLWRPTQGGQTVPVMCGDVLEVGCNPNFNPILSGNFMCMGNCPPPAFPIQWELRQLPNGPVVASGNLSGPAFSLALLASYFNTAGMYELTLTSQCGSQVCPPCKFKINATGCCTADISTPVPSGCRKYNFQGFGNGVPTIQYKWDFGDPASGAANNMSTLQNPMHQFVGTGPTFTVTLTITDGAGCMATYSVTITVPPLPTTTITANPGLTICPGQSTTLTATGGPWTNCLWSNSVSGPSIVVTTPGTYCVTCTDASGCTATACATVVAKPSPTVSISGNLSVCSGATTTLTASGSGGSGSPYTYQWSAPPGGNNASVTVTPTAQNHTYTVTCTDMMGCTATASVNVQIVPFPGFILTDKTICPGQSATLTAAGGGTYQWSPGGATTASITVSPTSTTVYMVTVTVPPGCSTTGSATVTVLPVSLLSSITGYFPFNGSPSVTLDVSPTLINGTPTNITQTSSINSVPSAANFDGTSSWIDCTNDNRGVTDKVSVVAWVKTTETQRGMWVAGQYVGGISGNTPKGYLLSVGDVTNGTIGQASFSGRVDQFAYSGATAPPSKKVNDGQWHCIVGTAGNDTWKIYVDGTLATPAVTGPTLGGIASSAKSFTIGTHSDQSVGQMWFNGDMDDVRVYNRILNDCEVEAVCATNFPSGATDFEKTVSIRIFPNPNPGLFTVELPQPATPGMTFRVTDLAGRLVLQKQTEAGSQQQTMQAGDLPDGLYFLQVVQDGRVLAVEKFVKQH